jgi:hypothetical protein
MRQPMVMFEHSIEHTTYIGPAVTAHRFDFWAGSAGAQFVLEGKAQHTQIILP